PFRRPLQSSTYGGHRRERNAREPPRLSTSRTTLPHLRRGGSDPASRGFESSRYGPAASRHRSTPLRRSTCRSKRTAPPEARPALAGRRRPRASLLGRNRREPTALDRSRSPASLLL